MRKKIIKEQLQTIVSKRRNTLYEYENGWTDTRMFNRIVSERIVDANWLINSPSMSYAEGLSSLSNNARIESSLYVLFTHKRPKMHLGQITVSALYDWYRREIQASFPNAAMQQAMWREFAFPFIQAGLIYLDGDMLEFEAYHDLYVDHDSLLREFQRLEYMKSLNSIEIVGPADDKPLYAWLPVLSLWFARRAYAISQAEFLSVDNDMDIVLNALHRVIQSSTTGGLAAATVQVSGRSLAMCEQLLQIDNFEEWALSYGLNQPVNDVMLQHALSNVLNFLNDPESQYKLVDYRTALNGIALERFYTPESRRLFGVYLYNRFDGVKFHTSLVTRLRGIHGNAVHREFLPANDPLNMMGEVPSCFHPSAIQSLVSHYLEMAAYLDRIGEGVYFIDNLEIWSRAPFEEAGECRDRIYARLAKYLSDEYEYVLSDDGHATIRYIFTHDQRTIPAQVRSTHGIVSLGTVYSQTMDPMDVIAFAPNVLDNSQSVEIHSQTVEQRLGFGKFILPTLVDSGYGYDSIVTIPGRFWANGSAATINVTVDWTDIISSIFMITNKRVISNVYYARALSEHLHTLSEVLALLQIINTSTTDYVYHTFLDQVRDMMLALMTMPNMAELAQRALLNAGYGFQIQQPRENFYNDVSMRFVLVQALVRLVFQGPEYIIDQFFMRIHASLTEAYYSKFNLAGEDYYR